MSIANPKHVSNISEFLISHSKKFFIHFDKFSLRCLLKVNACTSLSKYMLFLLALTS